MVLALGLALIVNLKLYVIVADALYFFCKCMDRTIGVLGTSVLKLWKYLIKLLDDGDPYKITAIMGGRPRC